MSVTTNGQRTSRDAGLDVRSALDQVTQKSPRRLGQLAASILFVVVVVVGLVTLFESRSDRVEVLVMKNPVAAGQELRAVDLKAAEVAGVPGAIPAAEVGSVVGKRAVTGLVGGQVLTETALTVTAVPAPGERLVAIRLEAGRVPGGSLLVTLSTCSLCRLRATRALVISWTHLPSSLRRRVLIRSARPRTARWW